MAAQIYTAKLVGKGKRATPATVIKSVMTTTPEKTEFSTIVRRRGRESAKRTEAGQFSLWYGMDITKRIDVIRSGVPALLVGELSLLMNIPKETLIDSLGLSRATINRKVQRAQPLSREESERVMGMQLMIDQVQAMIDTDNAPGFNAARWLSHWLAEPLPALGGMAPGSYMDTVEGQKYVGNLLAMALSGAYA